MVGTEILVNLGYIYSLIWNHATEGPRERSKLEEMTDNFQALRSLSFDAVLLSHQ